MADEVLVKKIQNLENQVVDLAHPYVRYVDIEAETVRHKNGNVWANDVGIVSWEDSAHSLANDGQSFASSFDTNLGVFLWNIPDNLPKRVMVLFYDSESPQSSDQPVAFAFIFPRKMVITDRGAPISVPFR